MRASSSRLVVAAGLFAVLVAGVGLDRLRARATARLFKVHETNDVYALPPPSVLHRMAIGYDDAVASILWASLLYQYGVHVGQNRRFSYAAHYLRAIVFLDPRFLAAYKFASTLVTMQAVPPERAELDEVRAVLAEGTETLPDEPETWGAYATFMMYDGAQFLDPDPKKQWRTEGAAAAQRAVELGYLQTTLGLSGAVYLEQAGYTDLAIKQLERAYAVAPDDETRERIARRLDRLQAADVAARRRRGQTEFVELWQQQAAFLDEGQFVLVGPSRDVARCAGLVGNDPSCAIGWAGTQPVTGAAR